VYHRAQSCSNGVTDRSSDRSTNCGTDSTTERITNFGYGCTNSCSYFGTHAIDSVDFGFCVQWFELCICASIPSVS
jgi:hypothetical protein